MKRSLVILCSLALLLLVAGRDRGTLEAWAARPQDSVASAPFGSPENHSPSASSNGDQRAESGAVRSMQSRRRADGPHLCMTARRGATSADLARATEIAAKLRDSIARYNDYRVALADGYRIFMPNLPQPEYHFTNYWNGYLESFTFDPARPTSLIYRKTGTQWQLVGAMYTAPRNASLEELNERVPLGVARWHSHTNLCMPGKGQARPDWKRFGLEGSISTEKECKAAGGVFLPQVFGWMVHVYPFEATTAAMFAQ